MSVELALDINNEDSKENEDEDSHHHRPHSLDREREEMPWDEKIELLMDKWKCETTEKAEAHHAKAVKAKQMYILFGIPPIVVPVILTGLQSVIHELNKYVVPSLLIFSGLVAVSNIFFNFGQKFQQNCEFSAKYDSLSKEIEAECTKHKKFRVAADVFLERVKLLSYSIDNNAPFL
jgi:hypothetical protein